MMGVRATASDSGVWVELGHRSYQISVVRGGSDEFGSFVRASLDRTWSRVACRRALVVTDSNLAAMNLPSVYQGALSGVEIEATVVVVPPGEATKSLEGASRLFDELIRQAADRHTIVIALGGGVVGDLAGFVAATFARGLPLFMVPTTLLAQVDSSVGGKVGINHSAAKNMIGSFYQPTGVWIDTNTLHTLPPRELRCGLAEVVKYGVILDAEFFASLERDAESIVERHDEVLRRIVIESCRLKAAVVTKDEREETGLRAILNFGHTIGHAIEKVAGYNGAYQHGEAVAVGMVAEARLAEQLGWIGPEAVLRLRQLLQRFGLPTTAAGLDCEQLLAAMERDKKNRGGKIHFVLPRSIGQVEVTDCAGLEQIRSVLAAL
jgi:3-dehydroquinate synthase